MLNFRTISSQQAIVTIVLLACGVLGAFLGWLSASTTFNSVRLNSQKKPDVVMPFLLRAAPTEKMEAGDVALTSNPAALQIWESAARQALPPRKEPLTPPHWRVVGVTAVGNEKNVLILFDNQSATEVFKIGDKLPGGAKIVQISQDHLQISLNGQLMKLNLRKQ